MLESGYNEGGWMADRTNQKATAMFLLRNVVWIRWTASARWLRTVLTEKAKFIGKLATALQIRPRKLLDYDFE